MRFFPVRFLKPCLAGVLLASAWILNGQTSTEDRTFNSSSQTSLLAARRLNTITEKEHATWWFPGTGLLTGNFDTNVGVHFWKDHFYFRNLQFRLLTDVCNGFRINTVIRSNSSYQGLKPFEPMFDELYGEFLGYRLGKVSTFSYSLRVGKMRYLRFPYPDYTSIFDQVPGVGDLLGPDATDRTLFYQGAMLTLDYGLKNGLGLHGSFMQWYLGEKKNLGLLEGYARYRIHGRFLDFETRGGWLQQRPEPLGRTALGGNAYLGVRWKGVKVGGLLERVEGYPWYAGVLVSFSPSLITNILGTIHTDYTRAPQGLAFNLPVLHGRFGFVDSRENRGEKVGEIVAERRMTFWQNSQTRNFYEHYFSKQGVTNGDSLVVGVEEYAWYLKNESPVGPLLYLKGFDDILDWNRSSARLGEVAQPVVYSFYKKGDIKYRWKLALSPGIDIRKWSEIYHAPPNTASLTGVEY